MRTNKHTIFLAMAGAFLASCCIAGIPSAMASTTVTLEQPVHFTNAE